MSPAIMKLNTKCIISIVATITLFACKITNSKDEGPREGATDSLPKFRWDGNGAQRLKPVIATSGDPFDLAMALSTCDCATHLAGRILMTRAVAIGVLPQILVPQIRFGVANDPNLKMLNTLPGALGDTLKSFFATDEKIATNVRNSVAEKLQASLASLKGTNLGTRIPFRFDLFDPNLANTAEFEINGQVARWNLVAGRKEIWSADKPPLDGVDHGLQLLETARMAAEWTYMLGIDSEGRPNTYGGLMLDVLTGNTKLAVPYDQRAIPNGSGLFASGSFTVLYPNASSVTLATSVRESWAFKPDSVDLLTQARIWNAAALAFINYRYDKTPLAKSILEAPNGILSPGMQQLPLIWLNGMAEMFDARFLDATTRGVRAEAYGPPGHPASLEALVAFATALQNWRIATLGLEASGLKPELLAKLQPIPDKLLKTLQLVTQKIIGNYTFVAAAGTSVKLFVGTNQAPASPKLTAETIALLATLEQQTLKSESLRETVQTLYDSSLSTWAETGSAADASTIIAQLRMAKLVNSYSGLPPWSAAYLQSLEAAVAAWAATQ